jgi:hypothetical protein
MKQTGIEILGKASKNESAIKPGKAALFGTWPPDMPC